MLTTTNIWELYWVISSQMTQTFRDNCDKTIVQQTSCEPLFPDVQTSNAVKNVLCRSFYTPMQGRFKGEQRRQLPRPPRSKGAPRDEIYLFQIKYSFENFRDSKTIHEYNSVLYSYIGLRAPTATDFSTSLTVYQL